MRNAILIALPLLAGCTTGLTPPNAAPGSRSAVSAPPPAAQVPPPLAEPLPGGCGGTAFYKGGMLPVWAQVNAPTFLPFVVAKPGIAVGDLFDYPLRTGNTNKILWYLATPREGRPLTATGHPLGAAAPTAAFGSAAGSGPGEIYPSGPEVPFAGCWRFTLTWQGGARSAEVDLQFQPVGSG
ncbi:MAG: hypothetical protein M3024_06440 [Candidatus Dormibacteraeota bacterium]|nr:hypothetical protein [Candidatus Dormibacteraeota bacterium]